MAKRTSSVREDDLLAHIEDFKMFWVVRGSEKVKVAWNEMSREEKEEANRAAWQEEWEQMLGIYE